VHEPKLPYSPPRNTRLYNSQFKCHPLPLTRRRLMSTVPTTNQPPRFAVKENFPKVPGLSERMLSALWPLDCLYRWTVARSRQSACNLPCFHNFWPRVVRGAVGWIRKHGFHETATPSHGHFITHISILTLRWCGALLQFMGSSPRRESGPSALYR